MSARERIEWASARSQRSSEIEEIRIEEMSQQTNEEIHIEERVCFSYNWLQREIQERVSSRPKLREVARGLELDNRI